MTERESFAVEVLLEQPTRLGGAPTAEQLQTTRPVVDGSVLRGALGTAWIRRHGAPTGPRRLDFERLFESEVFFGPAHLDGPPQPLSVRRHKYPRETGSCLHEEWDVADSSYQTPRVCPDCTSPLEPARGLRPDQLPRSLMKMSLQVASDQVAADGNLVLREKLVRGQRFRGRLSATPQDAAALRDLVHGRSVRLGGGRSTAGAARIVISDAPVPPPPVELDGRSLTLHLGSPGILTDDHGRPVASPVPALRRALGVQSSLVTRWCRWESVGGWHAASGLPKPVDHAVIAGSTFVLALDAQLDAAKLRCLATDGLGLRRTEGFGQLVGPPLLRRDSIQARAGSLAEPLRGAFGSRVFEGAITPALRGDNTARSRVLALLPRMTDVAPAAREALRTALESEAELGREVLNQLSPAANTEDNSG